jgi:hypothetical protein
MAVSGDKIRPNRSPTEMIAMWDSVVSEVVRRKRISDGAEKPKGLGQC